MNSAGMGKGKRNENSKKEDGAAGDAPDDQRAGCHAIWPAHIPGRGDSLFPAAPDVYLRIAGGRSRGAGRGAGDIVQKPAGAGDPVPQFAGKLCQQYTVSGGPHRRRGKPVHCGSVGKDKAHLGSVQLQTATAREFVLAVRLEAVREKKSIRIWHVWKSSSGTRASMFGARTWTM